MATIMEEKTRINAFAEMKNIIKKEMKEQGLTVSDVKKSLINRKK